jgi:hypothetical protein
VYVRNPIAPAIFRLVIVACVAFAVARSLTGYGAGTLRYFTIQSNILVGAVALYLLVDGVLRARAGRGLRAATYLRGIAMLAISLTGIVFHALLAPLLATVDLDSHILHTAVPILFVLDWLVFAEKGRFRFRDVALWVVYPLAYLVATLLVAAYYDGFYPYPFMDAAKYGYAAVALNSVLLLVGFSVLGLVYVGIDKVLAGFARRRFATRLKQSRPRQVPRRS